MLKSNLLKQLYNPTAYIPKKIIFLRFISKIIINLFWLNRFQLFSNVFQQFFKTTCEININNQNLLFKDGNERLYIFYKTQYILEKDLTEWIGRFSKKDIFYDIGANVGMFSILAAKKNSTFAFECLPANLDALSYNILLNKCYKNITIVPNPLYKKDRQIVFSQRDLTASAAKNSIKDEKEKNIRSLDFKTIAFSLDNLVKIFKFPYPTKLKIDVDGVEFEILNGAKKTLKNCNEVMIEMYARNSNINQCYNDVSSIKKIKTSEFKKNYHEKINKTNTHKNFKEINKLMKNLNFKIHSVYGNNVLYKK